MECVDTVVIGAGHAGLAVSRLLAAAGHEHVVLERGRVGERWRSERWDSLHLLTPNWMTRLPGFSYRGPDPDGYQAADAFADYLDHYAASFDAPVVGQTTVEEVSRARPTPSYRVVTDRGTWRVGNVVVATGPHGTAHIPPAVRDGDLGPVDLISAQHYRNPAQLRPGGVLVVGASSSGAQIADELARADRSVILSVGRHTRMPRRYRGMDIFWWLESTGRLARTIDDIPDTAAARRETSLQLAGRNSPERFGQNLDLAVLQAHGVRLAGHLERISGGRAWFSDDLGLTVRAADRRMHRFLDAVDDYIRRSGLDREVWEPVRPQPVELPTRPLVRVNLGAQPISTIVLAAGYQPHHPWLQLPVTAPDGSIEQYRGVTPAPGVYVVGQRFQHRRDSGFIDGARYDAAAVVRHLLSRQTDTVQAA